MTAINETQLVRFWDKVDKSKECWNWTAGKNQSGYGLISIQGKLHSSHRVSYEIHKGEIPEGMLICHTCDNPSCVNPEHLLLGTYSDNSNDMSRKGRTGGSKLTPSQVKEIYSQKGKGITHKDIAIKYGVSRSSISDLMRGLNWSSITGAKEAI